MNYITGFLFYIFTLSVFFGCKPADEVEDILALSVASISAPDFASDYNVQVTTSAKEFMVASDSEWCTARVDYSKSTVTISVQKNRLSTLRKAKITITAGNKNATVNVNQSGLVYTATNRDSVALLSLNNGTLKWNALQNMDTWEGIIVGYVDGVRRVTELNIPQKAYLTSVISDSIKNLTELRYIDFSSLNLTGNLPALNSLAKLVVLDLKNNKLTGGIPQLPSSLAYLSLGQNNFSGNLPIHLKNLIKLVVLDLGLNDLTGEIPAEWSVLLNLKYFYLYGNVLSGTLPAYTATFEKLEALALDFNQLTGSIPLGLGNLSTLNRLTLQQNKLSGNVPDDLLNNTNWAVWSNTVIYQQNGVVLSQPTSGSNIMPQKSKTNALKFAYPLPDKRSYIN